MKTLKLTTQFKKDLKKYKHQPAQIRALEEVLKKLRKGETLPKELAAHRLKGNYKGHMECHVGNDLLLIWLDKEEDLIVLVRFGSHSELF
ncbi:MAG: type II toxin-antitoxin system YafQ family toxin [Muribaculaceae bacterium]|nr:type II toxin-antitoxin system YafQ family toxin [Muribaculaceae bacterium]